LDEFYQRCDATVVAADLVTSREALDRYFTHKQELPDAYALMSLEKWAKEKNCRVAVVSHDSGWKTFCESSERLVYYADLGSALDLFQPHDAVGRLLIELNEELIAGTDENGLQFGISDDISEEIETTAVEVYAHSQFYWETDGAYVTYVGHEFQRENPKLVNIALVRATAEDVTVRLIAKITCEIHARFALSMLHPIENDEISLGSKNVQIEKSYLSDVLVTFEGDLAQGLAGVSIANVELVDELPAVDFGEIDDHEDSQSEETKTADDDEGPRP